MSFFQLDHELDVSNRFGFQWNGCHFADVNHLWHLELASSRQSQPLEIINYVICSFTTQPKVCWSILSTTSLEINFFPLFQNHVVVDILMSFFQLDHEVDISFYLKEFIALCYSRELVFFDTNLVCFQLISLLTSWSLKSISFHIVSIHFSCFLYSCTHQCLIYIGYTKYTIQHGPNYSSIIHIVCLATTGDNKRGCPMTLGAT